MRLTTLIPLTLLVAGGAAVVFATQRNSTDRVVQPELSANPQATSIAVVEAHPFTLLEAETNWMLPEQPTFDSGTLLVVETEPDMLVPRQTEEQLLFVGDEPVRRFNNGDVSGRVVVVVPSTIDVTTAPVFFSEALLPERLTGADRADQVALALERGAGAAPAEFTADPVVLADGYELGRLASYLIEEHSPQEVDVITGLRAERIGR